MKALVVSCVGLGDGVVAMVLSHNLALNGYETKTYHNGNFFQLQEWFSHLPIEKFPKIETIPKILEEFDKIFVFFDSNEFFQTLIKEGKKKCPEKIKVLNNSFSKRSGTQPFYTDAYFQRKLTMVDNIENFCKNILKLEKVTNQNGMEFPSDLVFRKNKGRIIIHPTSAKKGRAWSYLKYIKLYEKLRKKGFTPVFVMHKSEEKVWNKDNKDIEIKGFENFSDLAEYIYESSFFIGNDSGVGHLASSLGIPTLTIFRSKRLAWVWKPGWSRGEIVYASKLIPNISGFRLRDKKWKIFLSTRKVFRKFMLFAKQ